MRISLDTLRLIAEEGKCPHARAALKAIEDTPLRREAQIFNFGSGFTWFIPGRREVGVASQTLS